MHLLDNLEKEIIDHLRPIKKKKEIMDRLRIRSSL